VGWHGFLTKHAGAVAKGKREERVPQGGGLFKKRRNVIKKYERTP